MREDGTALRYAIDLMQLPSQVRPLRSRPVPEGVVLLLRIAADDEDAITQGIKWTGRSRETVREAAAFFIEQILLYPGGDSYRVLGATQSACNDELRRNMALLLRWLHPDVDRQDGRSVYAARVTRAWNDLKTQQRRAAYDRSLRTVVSNKSRSIKKRSKKPWVRHHGAVTSWHAAHSFPEKHSRGLLYRIIFFLLGRAAH